MTPNGGEQPSEPVGEDIDSAETTESFDDEDRHVNGLPRGEWLDLVESNLDDGIVLMEDDRWIGEEEAIEEVGAEEVARLRAHTRALIAADRAELDNEEP